MARSQGSPCRTKTRIPIPGEMPARQDSPLRAYGSRGSDLGGVRVGAGRALLSRLIQDRRRARACDGGRGRVFAQVPEEALDGVRVGDGGDDAHAAVTAGAVECVDEKDPAQKLGPGLVG
jgi:hypothetical protein